MTKVTWSKLTRVDRGGLIREYATWPTTAKAALRARLPQLPAGPYSGLVLAGMGGSGAVCDVMRDSLATQLPIPILVLKDYHLPKSIAHDALVVAVSCSGDTEETVSAAVEARQRGLATIAISGGGLLQQKASRLGLTHVAIRPGLLPRSSFPQMFVALARTIQEIGLAELAQSTKRAIRTLAGLSERLSSSTELDTNPAKRLALAIHRHIPVIYCSADTPGVGHRFASSLNENAKMHALVQLLPELCHNEVVAWEKPLEPHAPLVLVRLLDEREEVRARFEAVKAVVRNEVGAIHEVWSEGHDRLAELVGLVYLLDYVSLYCALLRRVDPAPTKSIARLKQKMAAFHYLGRYHATLA